MPNINPEAAAWSTETGWRLMFVSEAVPAGLFTLLVLFVPETPRFELTIPRGIKISRVSALADDIALALGAANVRIAPIPDKSAVGMPARYA